jgi:hypothetical protein
MTPIGTAELVLLLVALAGMTAAATWAVIELKKPQTCSTSSRRSPIGSVTQEVARRKAKKQEADRAA